MDADAKRVLIERYLDAYNSFDVERIWEVLDRDIERNASGGKVNAIASGANEFKKLAEQSKRLFSSRQTVTKWELDGDKASVEVDNTGVLAVLSNKIKAGETLQLRGRSQRSPDLPPYRL